MVRGRCRREDRGRGDSTGEDWSVSLDGACRQPQSDRVTPGEHHHDTTTRQAQAEATYERLFGPRDRNAPDNDPELMEILRRFIFGDVFGTGVLDDQARELITVTVLACLQTLPQLRSHTAAALNVGVQPVEIREAVYQLAPFIGFPRTLNAVAVINEVFRERGITLPLPAQGTVSDADRYPKGLGSVMPRSRDTSLITATALCVRGKRIDRNSTRL